MKPSLAKSDHRKQFAASANTETATGSELLSNALNFRRAKWEQEELERMIREGRPPSNDTWKKRYKAPATIEGIPPYAIPDAWVWASAEEVCESVRDGTHDTPSYVEDGVPLVTSKNLVRGNIDWDNIKLISRDDHIDISKRSSVDDRDILFAMIGTIGNPVVVRKDREFSIKNVGLFKKNEDFIGSRYFKYWLDSPSLERWLTARLKGTTQKFAPLGLLRALPIPLAPLDQQKRIVAEIEKQFSRLDEAVANLKRVKANLKRYKAAVLNAAVEGRLVETEAELVEAASRRLKRPEAASTYETGAQLLQRILATRRSQWQGKGKYKEPAAPDTTDLPELPEGWVWATMPQLGELNRGKSKHRPRDDETLYGGPYPFIQTGDVRKSEGAITEYSQTYSEFGLQQSRLWPAGTLCITIAANIAETGILKFAACFPDSVVGFLNEDDATITQYVEYFIRTAREKLERFAPATAQKNINLEVLKAVAVPLPPHAEQQRIVAEVDRRLSLADGVEDQVDANRQRVERLRQSVLDRGFIGLGAAGSENRKHSGGCA